MDLSFYPLTLEAIDQADAESLCLFVAQDERPLTGLAGLADWRLSGALSRLLRSGHLRGEPGEALLTPPGTRLHFRKVFLFGLGPSSQGEDALIARVGEGLRKLGQAGVQDAAMQLPPRLPVETGIRVLVDELRGPSRALVFAPDPARLVSALSHAATRASHPPAQLERRVVKVPSPQVAKKPEPPSPAAQKPPPPASARSAQLPFAPEPVAPAPVAPLAPDATPAPPAQVPRAQPISFAPPSLSEPAPPIAPVAPESVPPAADAAASPATQSLAPSQSPAPAKPPAPAEKKPAPPPPKTFVPPEPKQNVFQSGKKKKR